MEKRSIKVVALSDLHGTLPPSNTIPECDLLLIGGDICGHHGVLDQVNWLNRSFKSWLRNLPASKIVGVAGNHDFVWQRASHLVPDLPWTYLQDKSCEFAGWKIYGSPWQPRFFDWAFNLDEPDLEKKWRLIPDDTDILVLHGPPQGFGDYVERTNENTGSPSLLERIKQIGPKLVIYGHIHHGFGVYKHQGTTLANVSILDEQYIWTNQPVEFFLDPETRKTTSKIKINNTTHEHTIEWKE